MKGCPVCKTDLVGTTISMRYMPIYPCFNFTRWPANIAPNLNWARESTFAHPSVDSCLPKPGCFTYLFQVHKINFHWILSIVWLPCWFNQLNVGSKSSGVGSIFWKILNKNNGLYVLRQLNQPNQHILHVYREIFPHINLGVILYRWILLICEKVPWAPNCTINSQFSSEEKYMGVHLGVCVISLTYIVK